MQFPLKLLLFFTEKLLASLLNPQELHSLVLPPSEKTFMQNWAWFAIACASNTPLGRTPIFGKPVHTRKAFNFIVSEQNGTYEYNLAISFLGKGAGTGHKDWTGTLCY